MGLIWILSVFPALLFANAPDPAAQLAGKWTGEAKFINNFTSARQLPVDLQILSNGTVSGTVGTARIVDGRVYQRPWWQFRAFNHYELRIDFKLSGALTTDGLARRSGSIALLRNGDQLDGWFFTDGSHGFPWQSREKLRSTMQLQARGLSLRRL